MNKSQLAIGVVLYAFVAMVAISLWQKAFAQEWESAPIYWVENPVKHPVTGEPIDVAQQLIDNDAYTDATDRGVAPVVILRGYIWLGSIATTDQTVILPLAFMRTLTGGNERLCDVTLHVARTSTNPPTYVLGEFERCDGPTPMFEEPL